MNSTRNTNGCGCIGIIGQIGAVVIVMAGIAFLLGISPQIAGTGNNLFAHLRNLSALLNGGF